MSSMEGEGHVRAHVSRGAGGAGYDARKARERGVGMWQGVTGPFAVEDAGTLTRGRTLVDAVRCTGLRSLIKSRGDG